jgi:hypothetical protein
LGRRLILLVTVLTIAGYLLFWYLGLTLTASAVIELEKALIQVNGLLIAFTGIIFTGMLAEVRFRTERATQAVDLQLVQRLERRSRALRVNALGSFIFFFASLASSIGDLAAAVAFPSSLTLMATVFVLPLGLMAGGFALLLVALALMALD